MLAPRRRRDCQATSEIAESDVTRAGASVMAQRASVSGARLKKRAIAVRNAVGSARLSSAAVALPATLRSGRRIFLRR
jgi:hypothetical protein